MREGSLGIQSSMKYNSGNKQDPTGRHEMRVSDIPGIDRLSVPEKILLVEISGTASLQMDPVCLCPGARSRNWRDG